MPTTLASRFGFPTSDIFAHLRDVKLPQIGPSSTAGRVIDGNGTKLEAILSEAQAQAEKADKDPRLSNRGKAEQRLEAGRQAAAKVRAQCSTTTKLLERIIEEAGAAVPKRLTAKHVLDSADRSRLESNSLDRELWLRALDRRAREVTELDPVEAVAHVMDAATSADSSTLLAVESLLTSKERRDLGLTDGKMTEIREAYVRAKDPEAFRSSTAIREILGVISMNQATAVKELERATGYNANTEAPIQVPA